MTTTAHKHLSPPVPSRNAFPSLIESPTDKSTDANNVENNNHDRPDDDNNNDDDIDCLPRQDKQPVLPQQVISPGSQPECLP